MPAEGVLLMAYGTPARPEDVEAYYTDIRRGRPPTPEQLADLVRRYDAIGGISPLAARTEAQRAGLQDALDARAPGAYEVALGFKHVAPSIEDAAADLRTRVDRVAARMREKFDIDSRWEGDALRFSRSGVKGTIAVTAQAVQVQAELGLMLSPLKGMVEDEIRRKLAEQFA